MKLVGIFKIKSFSDHACYCRGWWWCCLACSLPPGLRGSLGSRRHTRRTSRSSPGHTCKCRTCTYRDKNTAQRSRCSPKKERKNILSTEKKLISIILSGKESRVKGIKNVRHRQCVFLGGDTNDLNLEKEFLRH